MENLNENEIIEKRYAETFEKYFDIDESEAKHQDIPQKSIDNFKNTISEILIEIEDDKISPCPKDFVTTELISAMYAVSKASSNDKNILLLSKVATFLNNGTLNIPLRHKAIKKGLQYKEEVDCIKHNFQNILYSCLRIIDIQNMITFLFPYLYTNMEIEYLKRKISALINHDENYSTIMHTIANFFQDVEVRIVKEYGSIRSFESSKKEAFINIPYRKNRDLSEDIAYYKKSILKNTFILKNYQQEYTTWKTSSYLFKLITAISNKKYLCFYEIYMNVDGNKLYDFFETLNEPHEFGKDQIDYILETAPKLRIASYLNEEYAKYKKLYNPDAREFDFGVDEPEEETTIEEQLLPESEQIEDEKKEKLHLGPLSRFTKEQLIELLKKFRDRKEPFVHKETKQKNWLFVFGMKGDTPPKGFEKIKWEAKYNGRPAKGALIDFLELLGYDINQLYEVDSIKILNECFECYNPDNKLVPIDQNDFHYKKRTKERDHSKTFYDHFKRIIENIEKEA